MANIFANEGQSITRPPFFNGTNYSYWKNRMQIFIEASDFQVWEIILDGPYVPSKNDKDNKDVPKLRSEWDAEDRRLFQLNSKAINMLYCALDPTEYNRISTCKSAKEIWEKLEICHEGTNQVKKTKMNMLAHKYEMFKMENDESISDMYTRFNNIVNDSNSLGKTYTNEELVSKILRSLPKSWEPKVTAIEEAKNLATLPLEELVGSLMTHELKAKTQDEDESKKKKQIALKLSTKEPCKEEVDEDEEFAMMTRKFKRFFTKRPNGGTYPRKVFNKGDSSKKEEPSKRSEIICFECHKPGHIMTDCPLLKRQHKGKPK